MLQRVPQRVRKAGGNSKCSISRCRRRLHTPSSSCDAAGAHRRSRLPPLTAEQHTAQARHAPTCWSSLPVGCCPRCCCRPATHTEWLRSGVSTRVSPVELMGCIPTGTHNCGYGKLPPGGPRGPHRGVLPAKAGPFGLSTRGLSPGGSCSAPRAAAEAAVAFAMHPPRWPFVLRSPGSTDRVGGRAEGDGPP